MGNVDASRNVDHVRIEATPGAESSLIRMGILAWGAVASVFLVYLIDAIGRLELYSRSLLLLLLAVPAAAVATTAFLAACHVIRQITTRTTLNLSVRVGAYVLTPLYGIWLYLVDVSFFGYGRIGDAVPTFCIAGVVAMCLSHTALFCKTVSPAARRTWQRMPGHLQSPRIRVFLGYGLTLAGCMALFAIYSEQYVSKARYPDRAYFGGDIWEYQSIAVNFAKGHGFPVFGQLEPFSVYRFGRGDDDSVFKFGRTLGFDPDPPLTYRAWYAAVGERGGVKNFYRAPGYPFLLGLFYKYNGISPAAAKKAQFRLIALIAAFLPLVGFMAWGWGGLPAGAAAGYLYLRVHAGHAWTLMTESVTAFWVFLIVTTFLIWTRRRNIWTSLVFGFSLSGAFLVKGVFLFMPLLVTAYLALKMLTGRVSRMQTITVMLALIVPIAAWSSFASLKSGSFVLLSTQAKYILLGGNSIEAVNTGTHSSAGWRQPDSFYQREDIKDLSPLKQVAGFYCKNRHLILPMIANKVRAGFAPYPFFRLSMLFVCLHAVWTLARQRFASKPTRGTVVPILTAIWFCAALTIGALLFTRDPFVLFRGDMLPLLTLSALLICTVVVFSGGSATLPVPDVFLMLAINLVIVTIIGFGYPRFVMPFDFLFMLTGIYWLIGMALAATSYLRKISKVSRANLMIEPNESEATKV